MLARMLTLAAVLLGLAVAPAAADEWPDGKTFVVGFAQDTMANDWRIAQVKDVERELAAYPFIRFVYTNAGGQTAKQILDIQTLAEQGVDLLITSPRDAEAMAPVIREVYEGGTPVILSSRSIPGDAYTTFVHASNRQIAAKAARFLADRLDGQGRILILQHIPTTTPGIHRTEGFLDEIGTYPGIEVAAIKRGDSLRAKAIQAVEEALAEDLAFDAIYAQSDSMADGARMALRHAGIDPGSIPTVGIDYIKEAQEAIRAGEQAASFVYPTFGKETARLVLDILQGKTVPKEVVVESRMITRDNVDTVDPIF